jgi:hypothetical protein
MRKATRRLAALAMSVVAIVAGVAGPAGGQTIDVSGSFTGTGSFTFACDFVHEVNSGTGDWAGLCAITWSLDFCVAAAGLDEPWPITSGTFTVTAASGTLTGTMGGSVLATRPVGPNQYPVTYVLTVTGGTRDLAGATGQLTLDGLAGYVAPFGRTIDGTVSGSITVVRTPASAGACKQDAWRTLTDGSGTAFRNQGDCVSWANHNA